MSHRRPLFTFLDFAWWGHRKLVCRLIGWMKRGDGHDWDGYACYPANCRWCGVTGWPRV